jgi:hypothetical protein
MLFFHLCEVKKTVLRAAANSSSSYIHSRNMNGSPPTKHTKYEKGGDCMSKENTAKPKQGKPSEKNKKPVAPGDIKGKIEIPDTRERRDGPGGN